MFATDAPIVTTLGTVGADKELGNKDGGGSGIVSLQIPSIVHHKRGANIGTPNDEGRSGPNK